MCQSITRHQLLRVKPAGVDVSLLSSTSRLLPHYRSCGAFDRKCDSTSRRWCNARVSGRPRNIISASTNHVTRFIQTHRWFANEGSAIAPGSGASGLGPMHLFIAFCRIFEECLPPFLRGNMVTNSTLHHANGHFPRSDLR